jgi:pterin-4a-carbinolamine dehydratase
MSAQAIGPRHEAPAGRAQAAPLGHLPVAERAVEGRTMAETLPLPEGWEAVERPPSLFRRFQFTSYRETRAFLDRLAKLSEETKLYPDLGFGTTHVNVTVHGSDGKAPGEREIDFVGKAAKLALPV